LRARQLYEQNKEKYLLEYPYIVIVVKRAEEDIKKARPRRNDYWPEAEKRMKSILPEIYQDARKDGGYGQMLFHYSFTCPTKNLSVAKLKKIIAKPEVTMFWPGASRYTSIPPRLVQKLNSKSK
jgi:hypothetical protein